MSVQKITLLIPLLIISGLLFSQDKSDKVICDYFYEFFQSQKTIDFLQSKKDSLIVAYDADSILTKCGINSWGNKRLTVITSGENINKLKKDGIFAGLNDTTKFIIVSKNTIEELTYYRVFMPRSGADGHYSLKQINGQYVKQKTEYGWF